MSTSTTRSDDVDGNAGLTTHGCQRAITAHTDLDGDREGVGPQRSSLRAMLGALVRRGRPLSEHDLRAYFKSANADVPKQGHYMSNRYAQFYDDVARPQLLAVPGVEETDGGLRFVGADPSAFDVDTEHLRPLDELRADPRTKALNALDDRFDPHSAERENILKLYDAIRGSDQIGESELERKHVFRVSSDALDVLAELPGIEKEVKQPPEPEDFSIDTYADVLAAKREIEQADGPEIIWRASDE